MDNRIPSASTFLVHLNIPRGHGLVHGRGTSRILGSRAALAQDRGLVPVVSHERGGEARRERGREA